ncbi:hypothetical protein FHX06_000948 [Rhizobium sp. BK512]|nr:hypothetical protein [Rhizobium sp. BK379]MBB3559651.1 hypothetical protein [Rhizobium sp. BK512]
MTVSIAGRDQRRPVSRGVSTINGTEESARL